MCAKTALVVLETLRDVFWQKARAGKPLPNAEPVSFSFVSFAMPCGNYQSHEGSDSFSPASYAYRKTRRCSLPYDACCSPSLARLIILVSSVPTNMKHAIWECARKSNTYRRQFCRFSRFEFQHPLPRINCTVETPQGFELQNF